MWFILNVGLTDLCSENSQGKQQLGHRVLKAPSLPPL